MSIITIVGAGMMGSAMSFPASENGHEVRLVGTPLDREIIKSVAATHFHPKLQRKLPDSVQPFQIEELESALDGADFLIGGVSSFGVEWFIQNVLPNVPDTMPVLSVTKGLADQPDGELLPLPYAIARKLPPNRKLSLNAIGGPCTSYELADHRQTTVAFCGEDYSILEKLKSMLSTPYYHISLTNDVRGIECAVAMKNAYALGVSLAIGIAEKENGSGNPENYNPQAALFGQSVREMAQLIELLGGQRESIVYAAGDLYVTIFGGRTRKLGTLLGRGFSIDEALVELEGITLESVSITTRTIQALRKRDALGQIKMSDFPLLTHIGSLIVDHELVNIPWDKFEYNRFY